MGSTSISEDISPVVALVKSVALLDIPQTSNQ